MIEKLTFDIVLFWLIRGASAKKSGQKSENKKIGSSEYGQKYFWVGRSVDTVELYIFKVTCIFKVTWTFIQGHRSARKQKTAALVVSYSFQAIWMECDLLFRLVSMMNLLLILSPPSPFQVREPYFFVLFRLKPKNLTFTCIQTYTDQFL